MLYEPSSALPEKITFNPDVPFKHEEFEGPAIRMDEFTVYHIEDAPEEVFVVFAFEQND
jgi:hypothetical protein